MIDWITLFSAAGLGALTPVSAQWFFSNRMAIRERRYLERKEAYIGLLDAWANQDKKNFKPDTFIDVGHWLLRAKLVASEDVLKLLNQWEKCPPGTDQRIKVTGNLKQAMREDLRSF